eukprot:TRINITY_DN52424_c0_g1_i1.p2 TRINITY_DN52424_c0_g1~~TRINITY_DN52424_c0_g1_i1.p2  ORF type:complete len:104 (+),score=30.98 TRINITY_DN52424_c0_g1_i1:100-411(+)
MSMLSDRMKDYQRTLRQKRGEELTMKQVAGSIGGLYAVIHLLQYFDFFTLLIMMVVGYFVYRQIQANWSVIAAGFSQDDGPEHRSSSGQSSGKSSKKQGKKTG